MTSNTYGMKWSILIAHQKGSCVVATYTREVAETKAAQAMNMGLEHGCPCAFQTKPDE